MTIRKEGKNLLLFFKIRSTSNRCTVCIYKILLTLHSIWLLWLVWTNWEHFGLRSSGIFLILAVWTGNGNASSQEINLFCTIKCIAKHHCELVICNHYIQLHLYYTHITRVILLLTTKITSWITLQYSHNVKRRWKSKWWWWRWW